MSRNCENKGGEEVILIQEQMSRNWENKGGEEVILIQEKMSRNWENKEFIGSASLSSLDISGEISTKSTQNFLLTSLTSEIMSITSIIYYFLFIYFICSRMIVEMDRTGSITCQVTSSTHGTKSRTNVTTKHGRYYLKQNLLEKDVPVAIIFKVNIYY